MYIDFHTHILPGIDDGSKTPLESARILEKASKQEILTVIATPHFYPLKTNVNEFLKTRESSLALLKKEIEGSKLEKKAPRLLCGAECMFIKNISRYPDIEKLRIEGTSYLLLELPYGDWDYDIFEEIYRLTSKCSIAVIIAHPERFIAQIKQQNAMIKFAELGCLIQINAYSIASLLKRKSSLGLLGYSVPCVLGSDTHSDETPVQIPTALNIIEHKLGTKVKQEILEASEMVLKNIAPAK